VEVYKLNYTLIQNFHWGDVIDKFKRLTKYFNIIKIMKRCSRCLVLIFLLTFYFQIDGIGQEVTRIKRLTSTVEFDGKPFEEAWNGLEFFPMTMYQPNNFDEPSETSEVMITYDDEYVWIGARLYMKDMTKLTATSKKRDVTMTSSDYFDIILDSYNDNENAFIFSITPTGSRSDLAVSNDARMGGGGIPFNTNWNTFWDVKTSRDEKGWYAEIRIPFSSLRFKPENNIATMGVIIKRNISYSNEIDTYPAIDSKYGENAYAKASLAATIEFEGAKSSKPVYVSPYVIGGFSRDWVKNTEGTEYIKNDKPTFNAGLDVKYNINSNLTLDLTTNTDFAQVEADDQQVNLTRYSLYFPEKRMFFQERSNLFTFNLGGRSDLFTAGT
jgi:hypothetical protein